jgi:hypothetical protein
MNLGFAVSLTLEWTSKLPTSAITSQNYQEQK